MRQQNINCYLYGFFSGIYLFLILELKRLFSTVSLITQLIKWVNNISEDQNNSLGNIAVQTNQYINQIISNSYITITPIKQFNFRPSLSIDLINWQQYQYTRTTIGQSQRNNYYKSFTRYKNGA